MPGEVRIGCSGWNYRHWRESVYGRAPARTWLVRYARLFDTVEVNTTFYRLPTRAAVATWAAAAPPGFVFAVKASRYLTHIRRLRDVPEGVERLEAPIEPLRHGGTLGPVLWQLPGTFRRDDARLREALAGLPPGRNAFEFRHPSWFAPEVMAVLADHGVALVLGDTPQRPFQSLDRPVPWTYVRLHYGHRGRRGNYSERELDVWADRIAAWREDGDVYVYLNNDWETFAVHNAWGLARRLGLPAPDGTPRRAAAPIPVAGG